MVDNRCSLVLNNQEKICINGKEYLIKEEIGRGASCICYTSTSCENGLNYIIKEFYPLTCAKRTVDRKVVAKDGAADEFLQCKKRFEKLYENNLTIQKTHKNLFVEPNYELSGNGYIIMPARDLCTLSEWVADNIPQDSANNTVIDGYLNNALNILYSIVEQLEIYQKNNIIHFDIKPDNIFVFQENNGYFARIIDFDSMMTFSEIEELLDKNQLLKLYSTANCYGEETRASFYAKLKDGFSEKWKQLDVYPLGRLCTFILTGNKIPDIDDFTEDSSFLVSNKSETVNIRKYVFDRFIDKLTAGFGNRYSDAATVKFVVENLQTFMSCYGYFDNQLKYRKDIVPDLLCNKIVYETKGALSPLENLIKSENIFENKQSLLLVAECGMGKSTALRKLYLDAILFNQSKYRFVYYPLRECGSEKKAKNLEKDVFALSLIDKNNAVVLLDAFDESEGNDGGDCREELTARINAIGETNSVILTSRIEVKDLRTLKKVTCQAKDFSNSEMLKRIQDNSPWVKSLHGDILSNPFFAIMAEDVANIDDYAMNEKQYGSTCWNLIKSHLLGAIDENGQLQINYAGELIWNYYHLAILSQFGNNKFDIEKSIDFLDSMSICDGKQIEQRIECLGELGKKIERRFADRECSYSLGLFYDYLRNNNGDLFDSSWYSRTYVNVSSIREAKRNWKMENWPFLDDSIYANFSFLIEVRGCLYESSKRLSKYQEKNRNCIQDLINKIKRYNEREIDNCSTNETFKIKMKLKNILINLFSFNTVLQNISFVDLDLTSIRSFKKIVNCSFTRCRLFALSGEFLNCTFSDLQRDSFVHPSIINGYAYCENGNVLTKDKHLLVEVSKFNFGTSFADLRQKTIDQIYCVCVNAFDKIRPQKVVIPDGVREVFAMDHFPHYFIKELYVAPQTRILNFDIKTSEFVKIGYYFDSEGLANCVDIIHCPNNCFYIEKDGCIYGAKIPNETIKKLYDGGDETYRQLLWINKCSTITFDNTIAVTKLGAPNKLSIMGNHTTQIVNLPSEVLIRKHPRYKEKEQSKSTKLVWFVKYLLENFSAVTQINNKPNNIKIVSDLVVIDDEVFYDLNHKRSILYIPKNYLDSVMHNFANIRTKKLVVDNDFYLRKIWFEDNRWHLMNLLGVRFSSRCDKTYIDQYGVVINPQTEWWDFVFDYIKEHVITIDQLNSAEKEDVLTQQAEWDKYLNN